MYGRNLRRSYVGEVINGYQILEELPVDYPEHWCHQQRHNSRLFKVKHLETGHIMERNLIGLRNSPLPLPWHRKGWRNLTGTTCGLYEVIELSEESKVPSPGYRRAVTWRCLNTETGEEEIVPTALLLKEERREGRRRVKRGNTKEEDIIKVDRRFKHGARIRKSKTDLATLYRMYHALKSKCYSVTNRNYESWGGVGMVICREWRKSFEVFAHDIIEEIGYCPDPKHCSLFVKEGTEFRRGNVEWVNIIHKQSALTHENNYGTRLTLDAYPAHKKIEIEL